MANPLYDRLFGQHEGKDSVFLHLPGGEVLTHGGFLDRAAQFANAIRRAGLQAGDRLAVQIDKSPEALMVYAACARIGVIFLPLNTAYTAPEVEYFVENAGARLLVCDPAKQGALSEIAARHNARLETLGASGLGSLADLADGETTQCFTEPRQPDDLAAFLYTSGTTGRSKSAMLSQANLLSNAEVLADTWRFTGDDVLLHALPIFHTHGLFVGTNICLLRGAAMIFHSGFDADRLIADMPRATVLMGVPTFYTRLLDRDEFTADVAANMRLFISGSAPLLAETHRQFEARTGHRILERYGMTETNMNTSNPYEGERRAGTVGFPLPGVELKVCDPETGAELPRGEIGIIEVRGPNVFQGYWQMPEKTAAELREDGFFITGDLGFIAPEGYVTIVGRGKDLIISGGFNIYPKEVEMALDDLPGVLESAVIGLPHRDFGEGVMAVLVPEKGAALDLGQIETALGQQLARFKQPRAYEILPELPRNTMGKVQKNLLRDRFADAFLGQS